MSKKKSKIIIEDINDEYCVSIYDDFKLIIMKKNGYINASSLIKLVSKKTFSDWVRTRSSKDILNEISLQCKIPVEDLMVQVSGGDNEFRGTYVYPLLLTHIAYWISSKFAVQVSLWIEDWKKYSDENLNEYYNALYTLEPNKNLLKEKKIQKHLLKKYGGQIEAPTEMGNIDLLTGDTLFEIKTYDNWIGSCAGTAQAGEIPKGSVQLVN